MCGTTKRGDHCGVRVAHAHPRNSSGRHFSERLLVWARTAKIKHDVGPLPVEVEAGSLPRGERPFPHLRLLHRQDQPPCSCLAPQTALVGAQEVSNGGAVGATCDGACGTGLVHQVVLPRSHVALADVNGLASQTAASWWPIAPVLPSARHMAGGVQFDIHTDVTKPYTACSSRRPLRSDTRRANSHAMQLLHRPLRVQSINITTT